MALCAAARAKAAAYGRRGRISGSATACSPVTTAHTHTHTSPCTRTGMSKLSSTLASESKSFAARSKDLHRQVRPSTRPAPWLGQPPFIAAANACNQRPPPTHPHPPFCRRSSGSTFRLPWWAALCSGCSSLVTVRAVHHQWRQAWHGPPALLLGTPAARATACESMQQDCSCLPCTCCPPPAPPSPRIVTQPKRAVYPAPLCQFL